MAAQFDALKNTSAAFIERLNDISVGACIYQQIIPIEEKILKVKNQKKFLSAKLKLFNTNIYQLNEPADPDENDDNMELLKEKIISSDLDEKIVEVAVLGNLSRALSTLNIDNEEFVQYKKQMEKQYNQMQSIIFEIESSIDKQQRCLEESLNLQKGICDLQKEYSLYLENKKKILEEQKKQKLGTEYIETKNKIELKIQKINLMHILIRRLLLASDVNFDMYPNLIQVFEESYMQYSIEDFEVN